MLPLLFVPALIQAAPAMPPGFTLPEGLQVKPGSFKVNAFDQETFEVKASLNEAPVRLPKTGRTWRFILEAAGPRAGIYTLQQRLKPTLLAAGWAWQWEQRWVARRDEGGQEAWLKVSPSGSAALQVVLVQPGPPRILTLARPGRTPERLAPDGDFPYLTPWPGAVLMVSTPPQPGPLIGVDLGGGRQELVILDWIEKEYALPEPPSSYEFVTTYRKALEAAGWEIEGDFRGSPVQLQAVYLQEGRDIRLILRLARDAMAVAVADVGAQRPK